MGETGTLILIGVGVVVIIVAAVVAIKCFKKNAFEEKVELEFQVKTGHLVMVKRNNLKDPFSSICSSCFRPSVDIKVFNSDAEYAQSEWKNSPTPISDEEASTGNKIAGYLFKASKALSDTAYKLKRKYSDHRANRGLEREREDGGVEILEVKDSSSLLRPSKQSTQWKIAQEREVLRINIDISKNIKDVVEEGPEQAQEAGDMYMKL